MKKKKPVDVNTRKYLTKESTQMRLPVKSITDGIIITKDDRYVKIIEFLPTNFMLKGENEKTDIIEAFARVLKISPVKMQFKTFAIAASGTKFLTSLKNQASLIDNPERQHLMYDYINLIDTVSASDGVTRRFFCIIEYQADNIQQMKNLSFDSVKYQLNQTAYNLKSQMFQCGNEAVSFMDTTEGVTELLYQLLNRSLAVRESYLNHKVVVKNKYIVETQDLNVYVPVEDIISPFWADFTHSKYVVIDNKFYMWGYISSDGYSNYVFGGWLSGLINLAEGIDIDVFIEKRDKSKMQTNILRSLRINAKENNETDSMQQGANRIEGKVYAGYYLKNGLHSGSEFAYINTLFTVCGDSLSEVKEKYLHLKQQLKIFETTLHSCNYYQNEAFESTLPLCSLSPVLFNKSKQNILTKDAAAFYPFTSFELSDENGVLLGKNQSNDSLVTIDMFNTKKYMNANMVILGSSGSGKTFTMQCLATRMCHLGVKTMIISPKDGQDFSRACEGMGGQFIEISPGSQDCINVMEIRQKSEDAQLTSEILQGKQKHNKSSILSKKIQSLMIFFSLVVPDITDEQLQLLDSFLIDVYKEYGITQSNDSLKDPSTGKYKKMPVLQDIYEKLADEPRTISVANTIRPLITGSAAAFNGQTNVNLDNDYIVLDISELEGKYIQVGIFVAIDFCWDKIKEDKTVNKALFLDELWKLIGKNSNAVVGEYIIGLFKEIRSFAGAAIAASQDMNDLMGLNGGEYGKGIINNSKIKMIMKLEENEANIVKDTLGLTSSEIKKIKGFKQGEGLIIANSNNIDVKVISSNAELEMMASDHKNRKRYVEEQKQFQRANNN